MTLLRTMILLGILLSGCSTQNQHKITSDQHASGYVYDEKRTDVAPTGTSGGTMKKAHTSCGSYNIQNGQVALIHRRDIAS